MMESEWLLCREPERMLSHVRGQVGHRKLLLFACACCRRVWDLLEHELHRDAVAVAEAFADGEVGEDGLYRIERALNEETSSEPRFLHWLQATASESEKWELSHSTPYDILSPKRLAQSLIGFDTRLWGAGVVSNASRLRALCALHRETELKIKTNEAGAPDEEGFFEARLDEEEVAQCDLLRDIMGNPFRPPVSRENLIGAGNQSTVRLAGAIYKSREFDRVSELGDALRQAGCTEPLLLEHCRTDTTHVRGCWVIDLVIGKSNALIPQRTPPPEPPTGTDDIPF
jgi:hypothetical protein